MKKIFEKWACKHTWKTHAKKEEIIPFKEYNPRIRMADYNPAFNRKVTTEILICECGKIKKLVY